MVDNTPKTLLDVKKKLVEYAKELIPIELRPFIKIPSQPASRALYVQNHRTPEILNFIKAKFETAGKSCQLYRREELLGAELLESYTVDVSKNDQAVSKIFPGKDATAFLGEEKVRLEHNMTIALTHSESEVYKFINKAKEAGLITTTMATKRQTWDSFLSTWPIDKVRSMTLEQYTNLNKTDSFCYWLESITQNLGSIWGGSSYKFGIYKKNNTARIDDRPGYQTDGEYAWVSKYGADKESAFQGVKEQIIKIVESAQTKKLAEVDAVNLGQAYKWKIAALYHQGIPLIYAPHAINYLVDHFGKTATMFAEKYQLLAEERQSKEDIISLSERLWSVYSSETSEEKDTEKEKIRRPINQILFGPPGTGKTYSTINEAVKIVEELSDGDFALKYENRADLKDAFEGYVKKGQIAFTTFHQSMSYEDFIEGIKPRTLEIGDGDKKQSTVTYEIEKGIFRRLCENAEGYLSTKKSIEKTDQSSLKKEDLEKAVFYKMSLGRPHLPNEADIYDYCIKNNVIALGWGDDIDFSEADDETKIKSLIGENEASKSALPFIRHFRLYMKPGNIVVVTKGNSRVRAIGKVTGGYTYNDEAPIAYYHYRKVEWIISDADISSTELYDGNIDQKTLYPLDTSLVKLNFFDQIKAQKEKTPDFIKKNFVLIIDEINRGNVSQIFGELITLLEEDKRKGNDEALELTLPYSGKLFGVPNNLYLIGTMNTADRSVESLDSALRRRFFFNEMLPTPDLLSPEKAIVDLWINYNEDWENEEYVQKSEDLYGFVGMSASEKQQYAIWKNVEHNDASVSEIESFFEKENAKLPGINLKKLLIAINQRIEKLLDRDHTIGHAYFINIYSADKPLDALKTTFQKNIIPLLQEYFYGDYGKIGLVLGEPFVQARVTEKSSFASFKAIDQNLREDYQNRLVYQLTPPHSWKEEDFIAIYE